MARSRKRERQLAAKRQRKARQMQPDDKGKPTSKSRYARKVRWLLEHDVGWARDVPEPKPWKVG